MRLLYVLASLIAIALVSAAHADARRPTAMGWMTDAELSSAFGGRTIDGVYSNDTTFTESYLANGRLDYRETGRSLSGRWSVIEGTFCTIYDTIQTGGCYRVRQMSENCFEFYYAATDEEDAVNGPAQRPSWTARAWLGDRPSTCKAIPSA